MPSPRESFDASRPVKARKLLVMPGRKFVVDQPVPWKRLGWNQMLVAKLYRTGFLIHDDDQNPDTVEIPPEDAPEIIEAEIVPEAPRELRDPTMFGVPQDDLLHKLTNTAPETLPIIVGIQVIEVPSVVDEFVAAARDPEERMDLTDAQVDTGTLAMTAEAIAQNLDLISEFADAARDPVEPPDFDVKPTPSKGKKKG